MLLEELKKHLRDEAEETLEILRRWEKEGYDVKKGIRRLEDFNPNVLDSIPPRTWFFMEEVKDTSNVRLDPRFHDLFQDLQEKRTEHVYLNAAYLLAFY